MERFTKYIYKTEPYQISVKFYRNPPSLKRCVLLQ
jgi:hypothetical protein